MNDAQGPEEVDECAQECRETDEETRANSENPLNALDNVKLFQENHEFHQEAGTISSVGDAIACAHVKSLIKASYPF